MWSRMKSRSWPTLIWWMVQTSIQNEEDIKESHSGREAIIDTSKWSRMKSRSWPTIIMMDGAWLATQEKAQVWRNWNAAAVQYTSCDSIQVSSWMGRNKASLHLCSAALWRRTGGGGFEMFPGWWLPPPEDGESEVVPKWRPGWCSKSPPRWIMENMKQEWITLTWMRWYKLWLKIPSIQVSSWTGSYIEGEQVVVRLRCFLVDDYLLPKM